MGAFPRGKRPAAPFRCLTGYCPAWGRARKSCLRQDPCREVSHTIPPTCGKGALSASTASLSPLLTQGHTACPPCHLVLPLQLTPAAAVNHMAALPVPKAEGDPPAAPLWLSAPITFVLMRWAGPRAAASAFTQLRNKGPGQVMGPAGSQQCANCPRDPAMCKPRRGPCDVQSAPGCR